VLQTHTHTHTNTNDNSHVNSQHAQWLQLNIVKFRFNEDKLADRLSVNHRQTCDVHVTYSEIIIV